jgi:hypothetical protein
MTGKCANWLSDTMLSIVKTTKVCSNIFRNAILIFDAKLVQLF